MFRIAVNVSSTVAYGLTRVLRNEGWPTSMAPTGEQPEPGSTY